jgi:hypothetical protein
MAGRLLYTGQCSLGICLPNKPPCHRTRTFLSIALRNAWCSHVEINSFPLLHRALEKCVTVSKTVSNAKQRSSSVEQWHCRRLVFFWLDQRYRSMHCFPVLATKFITDYRSRTYSWWFAFIFRSLRPETWSRLWFASLRRREKLALWQLEKTER